MSHQLYIKIMTGQEVIEKVISYTGLKAPTLASTIGVTYQRIYDIQRAKTLKLSNIVASGIVAAYPELNKNWLLTGEGEMFKKDMPVYKDPSGYQAIEIAPQPISKANGDNPLLETENKIKYYKLDEDLFRMQVPLIRYTKWDRFIDQVKRETTSCEGWDEMEFIVPIIGMGKYFAFEIKGDSMDDGTRKGIAYGDFVLTRELNAAYWKNQLKYDKYPYWMIVLDNTIMCKQIVGQNLETEEIMVHSLNTSPEYRDFTIRLEDIKGLYNIVQRVPRPGGYL